MRKFRCIKTVLMNAPMSLVMAVAAQVINLMLGHISKLDIAQMLLSFVVSFPDRKSTRLNSSHWS